MDTLAEEVLLLKAPAFTELPDEGMHSLQTSSVREFRDCLTTYPTNRLAETEASGVTAAFESISEPPLHLSSSPGPLKPHRQVSMTMQMNYNYKSLVTLRVRNSGRNL